MTIAGAVRAILPRLVQICSCNRLATLAMAAVMVALSLYAASNRLGVTTDTDLLFSSSLPWKRNSDALTAHVSAE